MPGRVEVRDDRAAALVSYVRSVTATALLLVHLPSGRITAASPAGVLLLGIPDEELVGASLSSVTRGVWRSSPMRLLQTGGLASFTLPASIRRSDGQLLAGYVWVGATQTPQDRWGVVGLHPAREIVPAMVRSYDAERVVMGVGDGEGRFADVSQNVREVLGYDPAAFVGLTVQGVLHADDSPTLVAAGSAVRADGGSRSVRVRVRHADGTWIHFRVLLSAFSASRGLAFALIPEAVDPAGPDVGRLADLEARLRRIALEIAAVGVLDGLGPDIDPAMAEAVAELTPRRQEIVQRLQAGERVPTIAEAMFLSQSTVRNHLSAIFRRFGVSSQEELVQALRGRPPVHR